MININSLGNVEIDMNSFLLIVIVVCWSLFFMGAKLLANYMNSLVYEKKTISAVYVSQKTESKKPKLKLIKN